MSEHLDTDLPPKRIPGFWRRNRDVLAGCAVFSVILTALLAWGVHSARQSAIRIHRARNFKFIYNGLGSYALEHEGLLPENIKNSAGEPILSWRVPLFPYVSDRISYTGDRTDYNRFHLDEPWDSPNNRKLLDLMPKYYRSPLEAKSDVTSVSYFAVVGPHNPWLSKEGTTDEELSHTDAILFIELPGLHTPWMEPRDVTVEEVLDFLRPADGSRKHSSPAGDNMYITRIWDFGTIDRKMDRETLRKLLLGEWKKRGW